MALPATVRILPAATLRMFGFSFVSPSAFTVNAVFCEILMIVRLWVSATSATSPLPVLTVQPSPSFMPSFAEAGAPFWSVTRNSRLLFSKYTSSADGSGLASAASPRGSTSTATTTIESAMRIFMDGSSVP